MDESGKKKSLRLLWWKQGLSPVYFQLQNLKVDFQFIRKKIGLKSKFVDREGASRNPLCPQEQFLGAMCSGCSPVLPSKREGKRTGSLHRKNSKLPKSLYLPGTKVNRIIFLYVLVFMKGKIPDFISPRTIPDGNKKNKYIFTTSFNNRAFVLFIFQNSWIQKSMLAIHFFGNYYI